MRNNLHYYLCINGVHIWGLSTQNITLLYTELLRSLTKSTVFEKYERRISSSKKKYKLTTCFLLLLGLQFQELGGFQKRFDAHFCPKNWGKDCGSIFSEKKMGRQKKADAALRPSPTGRGSQSGAGGGNKEGNRTPPRFRLHHSGSESYKQDGARRSSGNKYGL